MRNMTTLREMTNNTILVHDSGHVHLVSAMATDLSVVNAARVSFGRASTELTEADMGLINFLMRERHGTPFEHNAFTFNIKCPIFVAREWFRHRIGSFNEFSGRYSEVPSEYYKPDIGYVREQKGKPGAYQFTQMDEDISSEVTDLMDEAGRNAFFVYRQLLEKGVAKEMARMVLPMSMYTQFYWTVNARALMNFLSLRTHETAQKEIRDYADAVCLIFRETMPVTFQAWIQNGKVSP